MNLLKAKWRPASLVGEDIIALVATLVIQATVRSWDYSVGNERTDLTLSVVEKTMPLSVWSTLFLLGAFCISAGMLFKRHFIIWLGHGWLAVLYIAVMVGTLLTVFNHPYADGARVASLFLTPVILHTLLFIRMGPRPLGDRESVPVAIVTGVANDGV